MQLRGGDEQNRRDKESEAREAAVCNSVDRLYPLRRGHLNKDVREMRKSAMQKSLWAEGTKSQAAEFLEFLRNHKEASGGGAEESEGVTGGEGTEGVGGSVGTGSWDPQDLGPYMEKDGGPWENVKQRSDVI